MVDALGPYWETCLKAHYYWSAQIALLALKKHSRGHPLFKRAPIALTYFKAGRIKQALDAARKVLAADRTNIHARRIESTSLARTRDYAGAIRSAALVPDSARNLSDWFLLALAQRKLGDFEKALEATSRALEKAPSDAMLGRWQQEILAARRTGIDVYLAVPNRILLGTYHLLGNQPEDFAGALLRYIVANHRNDRDVQLRIVSEVRGLSQQAISTIYLPRAVPGRLPLLKTVLQTPSLLVDTRIDAIREIRSTSLYIKVAEITDQGEKLIREDALQVKLFPRDHWKFGNRTSSFGPLSFNFELIGAWVTPKASFIETHMKSAKRHVQGNAFVGFQGDTVEQVKGIYAYLRSKGISYVLSPRVFSNAEMIQRVRLPKDSINTQSAQCLEGTILFASFLEAIGIDPVIVVIPGHSFLGWKRGKRDRRPTMAAKGIYFQETTMVGRAQIPFEKAMQAAETHMAKYFRATAYGWIPSIPLTNVKMMAVSDLRKRGITAQPYD